jgi:aldehyde dehydrogenase (NAD+)
MIDPGAAPPGSSRIEVARLLEELGVTRGRFAGGTLETRSPVDGAALSPVRPDAVSDVAAKIGLAHDSFLQWRLVPAPQRGELVRLLGEELRNAKPLLGRLVALETGKILQEGLGEVQEMIDICDFAVGLSRQLYGLTMATERRGHAMRETWHPLGVVGLITAFNFPVAVWAWNAALALVAGNAVVWKPSEKGLLSALAVQSLFEQAQDRFGSAPARLSTVVPGGIEAGGALVDDPRVRLISATGSTEMGREIGPRAARRFARTLLELGGNNAMIVAPSADLDLAVRAILFAAVGTAGQRCTSLRRLFIEDRLYDTLMARLTKAYASVVVGHPLDPATHVGPLIDHAAFEAMQAAIGRAAAAGGKVTGGERVMEALYPDAWYVRPALIEMPSQTGIMRKETFAPILYVMRYRTLEEAIDWQNDVPQGLASSIFTNDLREAERFMSAAGSDCGIANVNIGPSGAEIGGAFGGEKETGGGRESGSDSWKAYMRRATNTINYSAELPLAQGIRFDFEG